MQAHIVQIGNSLGLRLPKAVVSTLGLERDSRLSIRTKAGRIVLAPVQSPRSTWQAAFIAHPVGVPDNLWGDLPQPHCAKCLRKPD
jgi:antitoxin component of MazEF toxin-antitoxin module